VKTIQKVRTLIAREEGLPLPPSDVGTPVKRDIPKGHEFDARALKPLARALFSSSVALGHAVKAYKEFTRIKSSSISPDGMLGGKGYVLKVTDVRAKLQESCELLSSLTDTLYDELNGPHWKPKIVDLGQNDAEDVTELLEESEEILLDPERYGDKDVSKIEEKNDGPGGTPNTKKTEDHIRDAEAQSGKTDASRLPDAGGPETSQATPPPGGASRPKEASAWKAPSGWARYANSSVPVNTLPGPRVDHLDRGEQTGPSGSYNRDEPRVQDQWGLTDGVIPKTLNKVWGGAQEWGTSGLPSDSETRTEAFDFGVGYGAHGQGAGGYGTKNPDGRGVWGPQSTLPSDPLAPTKDLSVVPLEKPMVASHWGEVSESGLPFDGPDSIARTDYFEGNRGNQTNAPLHGNRQIAQSQMPGTGESINYEYDRDLPNTGYKYEQQSVPYLKRDWATHNDRNDMQDLYRMENHG